MSLIIRGRIFANNEVKDGGVRIENGNIVAVSIGELGTAECEIELGSRELLLPSAIDLQCAMRDWGEAERETVETATKAALVGGVTVVSDQANTVPRLDSSDLVRRRTEYVAEQSFADFGIVAHPPRVASDLDTYREAGAYSLQFFPWDLRPWRYPRDCDDSQELFGRSADLGLSGAVITDELAFQGTDLEEFGETYALEALLRRLDPAFSVRVSVTLPQSVETLLKHKARLPNMLIQVPHHALFASKEFAFERIGSAAFHVPPLRSAEDVEKLRAHAQQGNIDVVVSFHAPHCVPDKFSSEPIPGEFTPKAGYSVVEFAYPHMLTKLGIEQACRCFSEMPAKHLGLKMGEISVGNEANLVIVEENEGLPQQNIHITGSIGKDMWKIDPSKFTTMAKVTPFVGERVNYRVNKTFIRGEEAFDQGTGTFTKLATHRID